MKSNKDPSPSSTEAGPGNGTQNDLKFTAYKGDPFAAIIIGRWNWTGATYGMVYVGFYLAFLVSALGYLFLRNGEVEIALLGGYMSLFLLILVIIVVGGYGGWFYVYVTKKAGDIYDELATARVLAGDTTKLLESICMSQNKRRWSVVALAISISYAVITFYTSFFSPHASLVTAYRSIIVIATSLAWTVGFYMIAMFAIRIVLTWRGLTKVFRESTITLQPLHPDRCGGLAPLRAYALQLSALAAVMGFLIVAFGFMTSRTVDECKYQLLHSGISALEKGCVSELVNNGVLSEVNGNMVLIVALDTYSHEGVIQVDFGRTLMLPQILLGLASYVVVAPLAFFGTLSSAHWKMRETKNEWLKDLSDQFIKEYPTSLKNTQGKGARYRFENLKRITELHKMTKEFPVWPWDMATIQQFLSVVLGIPSIPILLQGAYNLRGIVFG